MEHVRRCIADELSDSNWKLLDEAVLRMEDACRDGNPVALEDFVPPSDHPLRRAILVEMIKVDMEGKFHRGEPKRLEQYAEAWPELANDDAGLLELLSFECGTAAVCGRPIDQAELQRRFPTLASAVDIAAINASGTHEAEVVRQRRASAEARSISEDSSTPTPTAAVTLAPGDRFGDYEIRKRLGMGGMGTVFLAFDTVLQREVALKIPRFDVILESDAPDRFLDEARAAARIQHPNICRVYHAGQIGTTFYIAMALVEGQTLADWLRGRKVSCRDAANIVWKLADALVAVHGQSILHRDIKPHNVMMDAHDEPQLMDFGLARRGGDASSSMVASLLGTVAYMPPELLRGEKIGPPADIYGLGIVLYEMLTGHPPYDNKDKDLLLQIFRGHPEPLSTRRPDVDPGLASICAKAMANQPEARHQSARELATALSTYLRGRERAVRGRTWISALLAIAGVLVVLGLAGALLARGSRIPPGTTAKDSPAIPEGWQIEKSPHSKLDEVPTLTPHDWGDTDRCVFLRFSADGQTFFGLIAPKLAGGDQSVAPFQIVTGDAQTGNASTAVNLDSRWQSTSRFAVSSKGAIFAYDYYDNHVAYIPVAATDKKERLTVTVLPDNKHAWITDVGISPDDKTLVTFLGGDGLEQSVPNDRVSVLRLSDQFLQEVVLDDEPLRGALAFSADSQFAYVGTIPRKSAESVIYELQLQPAPKITNRVSIPGGQLRGITRCSRLNCLYVSDASNHCIWEVSLAPFAAKRWLDLEGYVPDCFAINKPREQTLAVLCPKTRTTLLVDIDQRTVRRRVRKMGARDVTFAPDGRRLVFAATDGNRVAIVDTQGPPESPPPTGPTADPHAPWHSLAERVGSIVFSSNRLGENFQLYWTNADGMHAPTQLTFSRSDDLAPVWSPTGDWIAFLSERGGVHRVFLLNPALGAIQCLEATCPHFPISMHSMLNWSPDGTQIAFIRKDFTSIDVVSVATGKVSALSGPPAPELPACRDFVWSRTDKQLWSAWSTPNNSNSMDLFCLDAAGRFVRRVTDSQRQDYYYFGASPSPDGKTAVVVRGTKNTHLGRAEICLLDFTGQPEKMLARYEGTNQGTPTLGSVPRWSPDGKYLVYSVRQGDYLHLCRRNVTTGEEVFLPGDDSDDMMPDVCQL